MNKSPEKGDLVKISGRCPNEIICDCLAVVLGGKEYPMWYRIYVFNPKRSCRPGIYRCLERYIEILT